MHPEVKFLNGDFVDRGTTRRRHIYAMAVRNIGKEANEWEEQFYLGFDEDEQIDYGLAPVGSKRLLGALRAEVQAAGGQRRVARESGVARRTVERLMRGENIRRSTVTRILRTLKGR